MVLLAVVDDVRDSLAHMSSQGRSFGESVTPEDGYLNTFLTIYIQNKKIKSRWFKELKGQTALNPPDSHKRYLFLICPRHNVIWCSMWYKWDVQPTSQWLSHHSSAAWTRSEGRNSQSVCVLTLVLLSMSPGESPDDGIYYLDHIRTWEPSY